MTEMGTRHMIEGQLLQDVLREMDDTEREGVIAHDARPFRERVAAELEAIPAGRREGVVTRVADTIAFCMRPHPVFDAAAVSAALYAFAEAAERCI